MKKTANIQTILQEIAQQTMLERGFFTDFPLEVTEEVNMLSSTPKLVDSLHNMTDRLWVSIDNDDSMDLDQLTYAETISPDEDRIYIAIADVTTLVKKGSAIDQYAGHNTTSVYTPSRIFPMLPPKLSTDLTSLNEKEDRSAVIVEVKVSSNGQFSLNDVYFAIVRNQVKLAYNSLSAWLDNEGPIPEKAITIDGFERQMRLQDVIANKIMGYRNIQGALSFKTIQLQPAFIDDTSIKLEDAKVNRGKSLIENFMIAANVSVTAFMSANKAPMIRRVVKTPKRWDRIVLLAKERNFDLPVDPDAKALQQFLASQQKDDPEGFADLSLAIIKLIGRGEYIVAMPGDLSIGHFDLALSAYSHTTAPNRRYPDLIVQRLLRSLFDKKPIPYTEEELTEIAQNCTQKETDATKVERRVLKSAAAMTLQNQIGQEFNGMITGVNERGTWVRLFSPQVEGKLVRGGQNVDVGDRIRVRLIRVDVFNGFIDFAETH